MKVLIYGAKISQMFFGDLIGILAEHGVEYEAIEPVQDPRELAAVSRGHSALITFYPVTAEMIAALDSSVRGIVVTSIGYDTIDMAAAAKKGVMVCNIPDYSIEEVALHSVTLLLTCLRNICLYDRTIRSGGWKDRSMLCGRHHHRLSTLTMGFIGFGRIGQQAAKLMSGFGLRYIAYDPYVPDEVFSSYGVQRVNTIEEVAAVADMIGIYLILTEKTHHLIDRAAIANMKDGVILVNTAQGAILDLDAVTEAVESGKISGVGLDVWENEPPALSTPILHSDHAVLTSHCAYFSIEAARDLRTKSLMTAVALSDGQIPYNCVNKKDLNLQ